MSNQTIRHHSVLFEKAKKAHRQGEVNKAQQYYLELLRLTPDHAAAIHLLGVLEYQKKKPEQARSLIEKAITLVPENALFHYNLSMVLTELHEKKAAIRALEKAIERKPDYRDAYMKIGPLLLEAGDHKKLARLFHQLSHYFPDQAWINNNLGNLEKELGHYQEAERQYEEAIRKSPQYTTPLLNLGILHQETGDAGKAIEAFETLIGLSTPECHDSPVAERLLAYTCGKADQEKISRLESRLNLPRTDSKSRLHLHFALARNHEKLGAFDQAFEHYRKGNDIARQSAGFYLNQHQQFGEKIINWFSAERIAALGRHGIKSEHPVFIVGMPRSGSTLVEQILSAHPDVHGAGEIRLLEETLFTSSEQLNIWSFPDNLDSLPKHILTDKARQYLSGTATLSQGKAVVINKMLTNFFYIGMIYSLFPDARVIQCSRNALDTCTSCFTTFFSDNSPGFTSSLEELGKYYLLYEKLMNHWHQVLPGKIHTVSYEAITENPQPEIRRLLASLSLEWNNQCLEFHNAARPVQTASQQQVRSPLYRSSVNKWKNYAKHLAPLQQILNSKSDTG